ncbi:hypothetical protein HYFRA_00007629 [Hymenoscyphus fraxineus]|uniref:Histidine kinase n=1 Tax=Hymenoscyphus fraxineus TaxID=746836 RepID=A0A9N9KRQ5_9HELO|nr:hypothetical protein HYFRA_00007629 [Hymenoscyphus fraxineus]
MTEQKRGSRGYHRSKIAKGPSGERITPKNSVDGMASSSEGNSTPWKVTCNTHASRLHEPTDEDMRKPDQLPHSPLAFEEIGIAELLDEDTRPTFVLDLRPIDISHPDDRGLNVVFCNKSLRFWDDLRGVIAAETFYPDSDLPTPNSVTQEASQSEVEFREWANNPPDSADGWLPRHTFRGAYWTCTTLRNRWRVISASHIPHQRLQRRGSRSNSISAAWSQDREDQEESSLSKQLADSESKFRVLTELNPVGMYYLSPEGDIVYANDMWYRITGHPRGLEAEMSFMNVISEGEHDKMKVEWEFLTTQRGRRTFELRLRNPWMDETDGTFKQKWILASCDQEFYDDGKLKSIMGCITDISSQKHAEQSANERAELVGKLAERTQEAAHHARNFQQMAELAPCGMVTFDNQGTITWANPQWYEMTGLPRNEQDHEPMSFLKSVEPEDHETFEKAWKKLIEGKEEITSELRVKKPWIRHHESKEADNTWILFLALPQLDDDGNIAKVFGCSTDISHFKWAESVSRNSRLQAEEAKRQQEAFIDMTSHELRNPLSAIMLSADGIASSFLDLKCLAHQPATMSEELIESNFEAAQTITLCAQHQKRIIDDVLTLSKLNSALLHVTPVQVQIELTVRRTMKIFDSEIRAHNLKLSILVDESFRNLQADCVFCDPVRLTQVFINLLTNAIKFTRSEEKREISVVLSASTARRDIDLSCTVEWFPSKESKPDPTLKHEWGSGQQMYLFFAVKDTGRGLSEEEKAKLFNRFSQASVRTHVQYGGSGLGLFISRELTELQGGEIGVSSAAGEGSTFVFYIKARLSGGLDSGKHTRNVSITSQASSEANADAHTINPRPRRNYHILLVEDNLINQKVLSKQLRSAGYTVHVANHGGEALDFLSKTRLWKENQTNTNSETANRPMDLSIILMDLEMPIMDGLAATRAIRDLEREGKVDHVPIIAVTANARMEQMSVATEAGMDDVVPKPFQIPELMQKVDGLVKRS